MLTNPDCDGWHVQVSGGGREHECLGFVDGVCQVASVEDAEDPRGGPGQPLVPIDEGVVPDQRVQQDGRFVLERRVGVFAEDRDLRTPGGRGEKAGIARPPLR